MRQAGGGRTARGLAMALLVTLMSIMPLPPSAHAAASSGWLHTAGAQIRTAADQPHLIRATAWFGMETANCAPHGLWQIGLDDGLAQIASFGFNTIRLPFSNECLAARSVTGVDHAKNPELEGRTPLEVMDRVIARAEAHGLSVILDRHRPDSGSQSALWYTEAWPERRWIDDWRMLAERYRRTPTVVGMDLHNEPHGEACWGCADPARDWAAAATRAGNAVLDVNPELLVIVEGIERQDNGRTTWWGGGLADAADRPITLSVPDRLVYSPHDYPASVFAQPWFSAPDYPANLEQLWDANWGYLARQDRAPVLLGEFGTRLATESDRQWLTTLVDYLGQHEMSFAFWSFNPNSGDTGGLVADDWVTPQEAKLAALAPLLGRRGPGPTRPPSTTPPGPSPTPSPSPTSSPSPTPSAPPSPGPGPTTAPTGGVRAEWLLRSSWDAGYVAEVRLTAETARSGWTLRWADPSVTSVANAWGMRCAVEDGNVTCTGADWARDLAPGQPVTVGLQATSSRPAPTEPTLTVS